MNIMPFALTYSTVFWMAARLELPEVPTTRDHRLHSGHCRTSEKAYQCHSMMVDIDCFDGGVDLKIGGGSFCGRGKHGKENKNVRAWRIWPRLAMTVLMWAAVAVPFTL